MSKEKSGRSNATTRVVGFDQVVRGIVPGRTSAGEVTIFDSVGFALEDYAALRHLHALIQARPAWGRKIDLIPHRGDPKNLSGGALDMRSSAFRRAA